MVSDTVGYLLLLANVATAVVVWLTIRAYNENVREAYEQIAGRISVLENTLIRSKKMEGDKTPPPMYLKVGPDGKKSLSLFEPTK